MINPFKKAWKEVIIFGTWIVSVTSTFIIPLPSWSTIDDSSGYYVKFIILFSTVISGLLVFYTYRNKKIKVWTRLSVLFLMMLTASYWGYSHYRATKTLPYEGMSVVIGDERTEQDPLGKLEEQNEGPLLRGEIMKNFFGNSEMAWTPASIRQNKSLLIITLTASYVFSALLMISFSNLIILNQEKNAKKKKVKSRK